MCGVCKLLTVVILSMAIGGYLINIPQRLQYYWICFERIYLQTFQLVGTVKCTHMKHRTSDSVQNTMMLGVKTKIF